MAPGLKNFRAVDFTTFDATNNTTTAATAGAPGSFTGSTPENLSVLKADPEVGDSGTNKPGAVWTTGQYVVLGNGSRAHWNGTAWLTGTRSMAESGEESAPVSKSKTKAAPAVSDPDLVLPKD